MLSIIKVASALLAFASFVSATITIQTTSLKGNATNTITWKASNIDTDPEIFTIELANPLFRDNLALVNNVGTAQGSATFTLPDVLPGPNFSIVFINPGNIADIIAQSNTFTIAENDVGTGASSPDSTTVTSQLSTAGITITAPLPSKTSTNITSTQSASRSLTSTLSSITSSSTPPSTVASTTPSAAASSAAPNAAGIVHVPVAFLALGLVAGLM